MTRFADRELIQRFVPSFSEIRELNNEEPLGTTAVENGFIVIGDTKSPPDFQIEGCRYYSVDAQLATGLSFARKCPTRQAS